MTNLFAPFHPSNRGPRTKSRRYWERMRRVHSLRFERLEDRRVLSTNTWISLSGGSWHDAGNWSLGHAPAAGDDAVIPDLSGNQTITFSTSSTVVQSISSSEQLIISGGSLRVASALHSAGGLTLTGGILTGASISSGTNIRGIAGTMDGVTVDGEFLMVGAVNVVNGLTMNGTATLGDPADSNQVGILIFAGAQTLDGAGSVVFGNSNPGNGIVQKIADAALTIGAGMTVRGDTGFIGFNPTHLLHTGLGGSGHPVVINQGIVQADISGGTITIWTSRFGRSDGALRALNGGTLSLAGIGQGWTAAGVNEAGTGSRFLLGAVFDNANNTMRLSGGGVFEPLGDPNATIRGGILEIAPETSLRLTMGVLDGVTVNGNFLVVDIVDVVNGLTVNGTAMLGDPANADLFGRLRLSGSQTLGGTGAVVFGNNNSTNRIQQVTAGAVVTIGPGFTLKGLAGVLFGAASTTLINQGTIRWSPDATFQIALALINEGTLQNYNGTTLLVSGTSNTDGQSFLSTVAGAKLTINGDLAGNTTAAAAFVNSGDVQIVGGTEFSPRLLEAMSLDRGLGGSSANSNFYYNVLQVGANSYVHLTDLHRNSSGTSPEVVYAGSLIVPAGSTLDLNGRTLYTRLAKIDGAVVGGTIRQIPDSGPILTASPTPGSIGVAGELDEWTFYSRANRSVTIQLNPSAIGKNAPLSPRLDRAQLTLLNPAGEIVATANNAASGGAFSLDDVLLNLEGTYRIQIRAAAGFSNNTGNYTVALNDVTADVANTLLGKTEFGAIENEFAVDRWNFSASQGQQISFQLRATSNPEIAFALTGPDGFQAFSDLSASSSLINLPATGEYQLSAHGRNGATGQYSFQLQETSLTELPLSQVVTRTNGGTRGAQLFRIHLDESTPLLVQMDDPSETNQNLLFAKLGAPPTLVSYDYSSLRRPTSNRDTADVKGSADPLLLIPNAILGDWYVLVYGNFVPEITAFTIEATASSVVLNRTNPDRFLANTKVDLNLSGAGFRSGATVQLTDDTNNVAATATDVQIDSFTQLSATMPLAGIVPGKYGIRVTLPDGSSDTFPQSFTVLPAGEAKLETRLIMPSTLGRPSPATLYVEYANTGTVSMPAPLLRVQSADPDDSDHPILTLDQSRIIAGVWGKGRSEAIGESVQFLASGATPGVLSPGERITIPVYYLGLKPPLNFGDNQIEMEIRIFDSNNTDAIPWDTFQEELRPPPIASDAWNTIFNNLALNVGPTWGDFVDMLTNNAKYLNRVGRNVVDVSQLWSFEVQQAIGFSPLRTLASSVDAAVTTPGADLSFGRFWSLSLDQRSATSLFGRGWSTPWQARLEVEADGTVNIFGAGGSRRRFEPDSRSINKFFSLPGDTGTLVRIAAGVYEVREQNGSLTRFDANGRLGYTQDVNGNRVTAGYDGASRLSSLTHSSGGSIAIGYNAAGLIQTLTDSAGRASAFSYDAANQYLLTSTGPDGVITSYTYDTTPGSPRQHALTSVTTGGITQVFEFDTRGRLSATATRLSPTSESGRITFDYDSAGRVGVTDAAGGMTNLFYDDRGLLTKVTDPFGNVTTTEYGDDLRISRIVDPLGQSQAFTWCGCGSLASTTDQLGHKTTFTHEYVGPNNTIRRMTSFTDANGNKTRYTYDNKGNLTSTIYPNGSVERTTAYDPVGDALTFINRRGQVMNYAYNAAGQVTRQTFNDGSFIDLVYDARGNLKTVTEPGDKVTTYTYDAGDRLTKVLYPQGRFLEFTYDAAGRRSTMTDQLGYVVRYSYDAAGRLFQLHDTNNVLIVDYQYDVAGRLSRTNKGNGTFTVNTYDAAGQILSIDNHAPDGTVNSSFVYTYDALGRRITMSTIDGDWVYGYDPTGQLTSAVFTPLTGSPVPAQNLQYVYDALGNRIRTIENGVTIEYTTNNLNQYTQVGNDTFIYDADGNLISRSGLSINATYSYDQQNRLIRVVTPEGVWKYEYDVFGNRTASTIDGIWAEYLLDPSRLNTVVSDYDANNMLTSRYMHGRGIVSQQDQFFEFDDLGNVVGVTDSTGMIQGGFAYSPFGKAISETSSYAAFLRFIGEFGVSGEGNGLSMMGARFYDRTLGRFTSVDPIGLNSGDLNFYRYVLNSPVSFVDPFGTKLWTPGAIKDIGEFVGHILSGKDILESLGMLGDTLFGSCQQRAEAIGGIAGTLFGFSSPGRTISNVFTFIIEYVVLEPRFRRWTDFPGVFGRLAGPLAAGFLLGEVGAALGRSAGQFICDPLPREADSPVPPGGDNGDKGDSGTSQSSDPNELIGPSGYGPINYVNGDATLPYRINFENYGPGSVENDGTPAPPSRWATAPAQRAEITNVLPAQIDLDTFALTGFGFGDFIVPILAASADHEQILTMTFGGKAFEVWFSAALDRVQRTLHIVFQSVDPTTQVPPEVLYGFLPPEDGTGRGKGFVTYAARAIAGLATGTEIRNVALISFDHQPAIATNQVDPLDPALGTDPNREARVTIDAGAPSSSVLPLPAATTASEFMVQWSGTDDTGGSGIASYDVFVSQDGEPFAIWLNDATDTAGVFSGVVGKTYTFYSVATDNVGKQEVAPAGAQANTFVQTPSVITVTSSQADGSTYGQAVTFSATVSAGDSSPTMPTGFIQFQIDGGNFGSPVALVDGQAEVTTPSVPAGLHQVTATYTSNNIVFGDSTTIAALEQNVGKAALTITADSKSRLYGTSNPSFTATIAGFVLGDDLSDLSGQLSFDTPANVGSAVGDYPIVPSGLTSTNYNIAFVDETLHIDPVPLLITAENKAKVYGTALPVLTAAYNGFVNGDDPGDLTQLPTLSTAATQASHVGQYGISAADAASPNYAITYASGTLTVVPAPLLISAENNSMIYGVGLPTFTVRYGGFVNGDGPGNLTQLPGITTTAVSTSHVGSYPISATGAESANYTITYADGALTITPAALLITADDKAKVYGQAVPGLTVRFSGFVNGDDASDLTSQPVVSTTATAASHVGAYEITATGATSGDYAITYASGTLTVTPTPLLVMAEDMSVVYGAGPPILTALYSGFVNGDSAASLTAAPQLTTTATSSSHVGQYDIVASGATSSDYAFSYVSGTLTITRAPLLITAEDKSKVYGAVLPGLTVRYEGFVNGDEDSNLTALPAVSTRALPSSHVGAYVIQVTGAEAANYEVTYAPGVLTVTPAPLLVTAEDKSMVYGAGLPELTANYNGFVNGDSPASLTERPTLSTSATQASHAGVYAITAAGAVNSNYLISYMNGELTITPAPLLVTAEDKSKAYGAEMPALTANYSGFVNGDNSASLVNLPTLSTSATQASHAGIYTITAAGAESADYTITYVNGVLAVVRVPLLVTAEDKTKVYGAELPELTARYDGFVNGDGPGSISQLPSLTTAATSATHVGEYVIHAAGAASGNYEINYAEGLLTITPAPLSIIAENKTKHLWAALPELTVRYSGFVNGDSVESLTSRPSLTTSATLSSPLGEYPIRVDGAASPDYSITYVEGILAVNFGPALWRNPIDPYDVDGNGTVNIGDALEIVLQLRFHGNPHTLPATPTPEEYPPPFIDLDGNGLASLNDLLLEIQELRARIEGQTREQLTEPEGELILLWESTRHTPRYFPLETIAHRRWIFPDFRFEPSPVIRGPWPLSDTTRRADHDSFSTSLDVATDKAECGLERDFNDVIFEDKEFLHDVLAGAFQF